VIEKSRVFLTKSDKTVIRISTRPRLPCVFPFHSHSLIWLLSSSSAERGTA